MNRELDGSKVRMALNVGKLPTFTKFEEVTEFVTNYLIKRYRLYCARDINNGYCFVWGYLVWALWDGKVSFYTSDYHVAVRYGDKYYDSEHIRGTDYPELILGDYEYLGFLNVYQMVWYWARCGYEKHVLRRFVRLTNKEVYKFVLRNGFGTGEGLSIEDIP
jgi:hypothetical protein